MLCIRLNSLCVCFTKSPRAYSFNTKLLGIKWVCKNVMKLIGCSQPLDCICTWCYSIFLAVVILGLFMFTSKSLQGVCREIQALP